MEQIRILCVDDEVNVLKAVERVFLDEEYEILSAESAAAGLDVLEKSGPVQIVISDYRMPGMNGVDFLSEVCRRWPETVRIVLSGYADTSAVVSAINEGQIYKFIPKPWNDDELKVTIANSIERYFLRQKNSQLMAELKGKNEELERINSDLEQRIVEKSGRAMFQYKILTLSQNILDALPVGVIGIDTDGVIVQCNRMATDLLNCNDNECLAAPCRDRLPPELHAFVKGIDGCRYVRSRISLNGRELLATGGYMKCREQEGIILVLDRYESDMKGKKSDD